MKNVEKNNRLIAEFMDWDCDNIGTMAPEVFRYKVYFEHNPKEFFTTTIYKYKDCLFHSSWDWLIPVIDKIYSSDEYIKYKDSLSQFNDGIFINTKYIDSTYSDVVNYIKWYNALILKQ